MRGMKKLLGQDEPTVTEELDDCVTLSFQTRMICFTGCFTLGIIISFMAFINFADLTKFAVFYSIGNIMALCSTMFLMGPWKQVKKMFDPDRVIATSVYLVTIFLTLFFALYLQQVALTVIAMFCQFIALIWYAISYIPFARKAVKGFCSSLV
eukprot:TRINITY_DN1387_c0_g1_i1.p1 TRINITY_DN1387_c0_g1~~TRINITY_DN1387_c0_g1_i1.p1  ORF type:complete len:153 (-),score=36.76 TRINITY_DN1387_c0_g1_i1:234-692(-)